MANYEIGSGTSQADSLLNTFLFGWFIGMITCVLITLWSLSGETEIRTNKIIIPEKQLTTDGKTIDTLYIYKQ
jgi:hypothetical protein